MLLGVLWIGLRPERPPSAQASAPRPEQALRRIARIMDWELRDGMVHGEVGKHRFTVFMMSAGPVLRLALPGRSWALVSRHSPHRRDTWDLPFDTEFQVDWARTDPTTLHRAVREALLRLARGGSVQARLGFLELQLPPHVHEGSLRGHVGDLQTVAVAAATERSAISLVADTDEPVAFRERVLELVDRDAAGDELAVLLGSDIPSVRLDVARHLGHDPTLVALAEGDELDDDAHQLALRSLSPEALSGLHVLALASNSPARWAASAQVASERAVAATSTAWVAWWMRVYDHDREPLARWVAQSLAQAPVRGGVPVLLELVDRFLDDEATMGWAFDALERQATIEHVMALREAEAAAYGRTAKRLGALIAQIQARAGGGVGQLAIAEADEAGAVSVVDGAAAGRLTVTERGGT